MSVGFGQILLIALIVFILFGAGKLPVIMADFAKGIRAFKKGMADEELIKEPTTASTIEPQTLISQPMAEHHDHHLSDRRTQAHLPPKS